MSYSDITSDIVESIEKSDQKVIKTTLKDLLGIDSVDKIYISYSQFGLPNAVWSNQTDFLNDMNLTVKNNEKLNFSDTMTTFFLINGNEIYEQYAVRSKIISFSPDWYDPFVAYIAGVWNDEKNSPSDSVVIYCDKMEAEVIKQSMEKDYYNI